MAKIIAAMPCTRCIAILLAILSPMKPAWSLMLSKPSSVSGLSLNGAASPRASIRQVVAPACPRSPGLDRTEAKLPLCASETSPSNTAWPAGSCRRTLRETPPMTRSSMARHASTDCGSLKLKSSTRMGDASWRLCGGMPEHGTRSPRHLPGGAAGERTGHGLMAAMPGPMTSATRPRWACRHRSSGVNLRRRQPSWKSPACWHGVVERLCIPGAQAWA